MIRRLFPKRCGISWCPPWTRLVRHLDWKLNHGGWEPGDYTDVWGPRSEALCALSDRITNNWAHD